MSSATVRRFAPSAMRRQNARLLSSAPVPELNARRILALWWPLAASWMLMGVELPLFTACVARMPDAKVQLAAYGSLVFPIALVIEAPIMMLLAAATTLAGDRESWGRVRRFMHKAGASLTALHALVAFTPLFDALARHVFEVPEEVIEPARLGLKLMLPWTWSIAYRRTHQGMLIRFEQGRPVMLGTFVRLAANASVYALGFALQRHGVALPGVAVGASAVASGVFSEATFIGWCTRAVLRERGLPEKAAGSELTRAGFLRFYVPLALTPLIALVTLPLGVAAMDRMPAALDSLAAWSSLHGLFFLVRTGGFAFNEVVLSLFAFPGGPRALRRFAWWLGGISSAVVVLLAATPLASLWFHQVMGLADEVGDLAMGALVFGILWPCSQALQSWLQGSLTALRRTRYVTEAILCFFATVAFVFWLGVPRWRAPGAHYAVLALTLASLCQTAWLALRFRQVRALAGVSEPVEQ